MKKFSPRRLVATMLALACTLFAGMVVMTACQKQDFDPQLPLFQLEKSVDPGGYLDFSDSYTDERDLSYEDAQIFVLASTRVKVSAEDGFWRMEASSAGEVNISQEVFDRIQRAVEYSNSWLLVDLDNIQLAPRLMPDDIERLDDVFRTGKDCVPWSVDFASDKLKWGPSYGTAFATIALLGFSNGVPRQWALPVLRTLYGSNHAFPYDLHSLPRGHVQDNSQSVIMINCIMSIPPPNAKEVETHMMIYKSTGAMGEIYYIDPQRENREGYVSPGQVLDTYWIVP